MVETYSTAKFIEVECVMRPVPPGTKATPRPPDRPREVFDEDETNPPPSEPPPENPADSDS
jgi:hypothetical protein